MMFCGKCGTRNPDGSAFCVGCGTQLGEYVQTPAPVNTVRTRKKKKSILLWLIPVVMVILAAAVVTLGILTGRTEETAAEMFINASLYGDTEALVELIPEQLYRQALKEINLFADGEASYGVEDLKAYLQEGFQEIVDETQEDLQWEYGSKWKAVYKIEASEHVTGMDLEMIKQEYLEDYGLKITDATELKIQISIRGEDGRDEETEYIDLIKIGRKWYLDPKEMGIESSDLIDLFLEDVFYSMF